MENKDLYSKIASEQNIALKKVEAVVTLLEEDATIPFIARYRKEATGSLDEVQIAGIRDRLEQLKELEKRRESILKSMLEMEKLTDELKQKIEAAATLTELEDIYLPYKPKRKTKASRYVSQTLALFITPCRASIVIQKKRVDSEPHLHFSRRKQLLGRQRN